MIGPLLRLRSGLQGILYVGLFIGTLGALTLCLRLIFYRDPASVLLFLLGHCSVSFAAAGVSGLLLKHMAKERWRRSQQERMRKGH